MVVYQRGIESLGLSNSIILTIWWKDLHVMYTAKTIFTFLCIKGKFSKPFIQEMAFLSAWYRIASVSIDMIIPTGARERERKCCQKEGIQPKFYFHIVSA